MSLAAAFFRTRWAVRAPIPMFRHGFGWAFGGELLMLEHRGRKSGEWRYVALEVVGREDARHLVIASGFDRRSQWYRNLEADPICRVSVGRRRSVPARADLLGAEDSADLLADYQQRHPSGWKMLRRAISEVTGDEDPVVPMVRLSLAS